jgi:hypothetical protein
MQAAVLQCLAGTDVGTTATIINYADHAAHAAGMQTIMGDEQWSAYWLRAAAEGSAMPVESTILQDVDASYSPPADRPLGVIQALQWRPKPGRFADFIGHVMEAVPHIERLGGSVRVMQTLIGSYPMTVMVSTTFGDLTAYGAYNDAVATDGPFQEFWAGVMTDPTADVVRSGVYLNVSPS